jgi:hypothetical protein
LLSLKVNRELEGRLPAPGLPGLLLRLTSRNACAPKLSLLPNGEAGLFMPDFPPSSSSSTAGSSPKLFLNSGDPEVEEVATLARLCLANAPYGEACPCVEVVKPRAVMDVPRRC